LENGAQLTIAGGADMLPMDHGRRKEGQMDGPDAFMEEVKTAKGRKDLPCRFVRAR
jgi:hypothetical protein